MLDVVFAALKFISILLAGIFGVIGLTVSYKDKEGRITPWGKRALIAVVVSSVVATTLQGLEVYKQQKESRAAETRARQQAEFQNRALSEIRRAVYPLEVPRDMYVAAKAIIPITDEGMANYRRRLSDAASTLIHTGRESQERGNIGLEPLTDENGRRSFNGVELTSLASLFPKKDTERAAWWILSDFGVEIDIYLRPANPTEKLIDPGDFVNTDGTKRHEADLHFRATTDQKSLRLEYLPIDADNVQVSSERMLVSTDDDWRNPKS